MATLFAVYRYSVDSARRHQSLEMEFQSARAVQHILVPDEPELVPGFSIQSVYKPFGEVGGDFFQICPIESGEHAGSVLAVIGDVSGKGMPAAMTVSLLVGTFRTLAHYTQEPGEILVAMNLRMVGRTNGGFTTCLVLRADPDGQLVIANAGHVSPYIEGMELQIESGLPLGLDEGSKYAETVHLFTSGQQLVLLTDGVVEARSKTGELYGFDRTAAISKKPAEEIAEAARGFGQDDDITVLTLTRLSTPALMPV